MSSLTQLETAQHALDKVIANSTREELSTIQARWIIADLRASVRLLEPEIFDTPDPDGLAWPFDLEDVA